MEQQSGEHPSSVSLTPDYNLHLSDGMVCPEIEPLMAARPSIRQCDLRAAREAEVILGRPVRAITRDNVTFHLDVPFAKADDHMDRELAALEARYGQG